MKLLNLGCGTKTSDKEGVINIDWSIYLKLKNTKFLKPIIPLFIKGVRLERFKSIPNNILVYNIAKGIPFASNSVDVVYHSHLFEHLDKPVARKFLVEVKRVLKPGGFHRIVVPDMEILCKAYINHIEMCETNNEEAKHHDMFIGNMIEQSVRKEAYGTSQQNRVMRFIENIIRGNARRRGETHQWMYDRINLKELLLDVGYSDVILQGYDTSLIPDWSDYGLDLDEKGNEYKPDSLYIEAIK